jgi:hypothetical protein
VASEPGKQPPGIFLPGLLLELDLPDLRGLLKERLAVFSPVDAQGKALTGPAAGRRLGKGVPIEVAARGERALAAWAKSVGA